jgi:hypothetical protein
MYKSTTIWLSGLLDLNVPKLTMFSGVLRARIFGLTPFEDLAEINHAAGAA